jgi:hypothetical protein
MPTLAIFHLYHDSLYVYDLISSILRMFNELVKFVYENTS